MWSRVYNRAEVVRTPNGVQLASRQRGSSLRAAPGTEPARACEHLMPAVLAGWCSAARAVCLQQLQVEMKSVLPAIVFLTALPSAVEAQVEIRLPSIPRPSAHATIGPWSVSATLGASGVDVRVGDRTAREVSVGRSPSTSRRTTSRVPSSPRRTSTSSPTTSRATAAGVLATADRYVGTRYVWGGATPSGFDCSGFVQYVFRRQGVYLPRTSRQQAGVGSWVPATVPALRPGDLMLFASNGSRIDHIAIYVGHNQIIHSSASGGGVGYDDLSTRRGRWFATHHVASRRVLADGRSLVGELDAALRALTAFDPPDRAPRR